MAEKSKGKVFIIGSGPGDSSLISVRGMRILRKADCVIYDRLIGSALLNCLPIKAKIINVGKGHSLRSPKQSQINQLIIKNAKKYRTIVRLKGGDPLIFGRASEELKSLADNNINFEIIPGITAASAAAACAGIVLTDRNTASNVTFVTGHSADGKDIDFKNLAKLSGTIVFYMAVGNMKQICQKLIKSGLSGETNVYVIANAALMNQKIVAGVISDIARKCERENIQPPAVMIIGKNCFSWFRDHSLFGKKILMTRDLSGNAELAGKLAARGAEPISCPTFEIQNLTGSKQFKQLLAKIKNFDWVFFTSPSGVRLVFNAIEKNGQDSRVFACAKIACIGSETAETLENFGIKADFVPEIFTSEKFADNFIKKFKPAGKKILLLRSALADLRLAEKLKAAQAKITQFSIYTSKKIKNNIKEVIKNDINWIVFASSFAAECFFQDFKPEKLNRKIKTASIGPKTSETLKKFGVTPFAEAKVHTLDGLIESMESK